MHQARERRIMPDLAVWTLKVARFDDPQWRAFIPSNAPTVGALKERIIR
jgi:hypothetical protein